MRKLKFFIPVIIAFLLISTPSTFAKAPDYYGGALNEYKYKEVFFLAGAPIEFTGVATVSETTSKDKVTTTYKYTLEGTNSKNKLTRSVTYTSTLKSYEDKGQTTSSTEVTNFSEKITLDKDTYTLVNYQFSQGGVIDSRAAVDYYSSNIIGRKIYEYVNGATKAKSTIEVAMTGENVGYKNFWGATETQIMTFELDGAVQGTIKSKVSDSKSRILKYEPNTPTLSSFVGGYSVTSYSNMMAEYEYTYLSQPTRKINFSFDMAPKISRLIVPKFRDLKNHSARDSIERLYSLGIFDESSQFFSPNLPMIRYPFIVGVAKAVDLRVLETPKNSTTSNKSVFTDLDLRDPDYKYVESAVAKGITTGISPTLFGSEKVLTRAQAVTILVRALGMEDRAPTPGFRTKFADDKNIPGYALDSVYVASEIGLVAGDYYNRFNPTKALTRAEASLLLHRFLVFLEKDLKQNYRDDIINHN